MINTFFGIGRTTKEIDMRYAQTGTAVSNFTLAINRRFDKEKTDFIRCVAFKKTAELIAQYVGKGDQIGVEGTVQTGSYQNNEGRTIYTTDIVVNNVQFLENKNKSNNQSSNQSSNQSNYQPNNQSNNQQRDPFAHNGEPIDISDQDLPF